MWTPASRIGSAWNIHSLRRSDRIASVACVRLPRSPYLSPMPFAPRRHTVTTTVGEVAVGSAHPIVVQSMTNTDTADVASTVAQTAALAAAGSQLVRVTVNNEPAA